MPYPDLDPWQYRIARDLPDGMPLGKEWSLQTGDGLGVTHVTDAQGTAVGVLLGFPIDLNARRLIGDGWRSAHSLNSDPDTFAEAVLDDLGGRFLWLFVRDEIARVYTDISAQVSCVYDAKKQILGSTAHALFDDATYTERFNQTLFDQLGVNGEGWFPCGLTAHHGLKRLLPNSYLDMNSFEEVRYWPNGPAVTSPHPEDLVDPFIETVQAQIEALIMGPKKIAMALTAGLDSRTILACARPFKDKITCVTVTGQDRHAIDSVMARQITTKMGIHHLTLPRQSATPAQKDLFIRRGGHCNGDSNALYHPTVWPLQDEYVFVGGAGGEVSRPPLFRVADSSDDKLDPKTILARLGFKTLPALTEAMAEKLDKARTRDPHQILDMIHLEDRYGAWYAVQFCCDPTLVRHAPFLTQRTVRLMMQLPPDWKLDYRFEHLVIQKAWPELDAFPYNTLGPWRDRFINLQRVLADPRIIIKKLRKLAG